MFLKVRVVVTHAFLFGFIVILEKEEHVHTHHHCQLPYTTDTHSSRYTTLC